jgi:hypothetical protein
MEEARAAHIQNDSMIRGMKIIKQGSAGTMAGGFKR